MKHLLWLGTVLVFCTAASGALTLDGDVSDWEPQYIFGDPNFDNSGGVEMTRWGAQVEDGYLNWFCEINQNWTDFQGQAANGKDKKLFPGLWIDADNSTSTYLADGGDANCVDHNKAEWGVCGGGVGNHRGVDVNLELGLIGDWVNGNNTGPGGEGPGDSMYNYWGLNDDVGDIESVVSDGSWVLSGHVLEARILLSEIESVLQGMSDGVTPGDSWLVAVGVQGTNRSDIDYGYDVGTPREIDMVGTPAGVPEPTTLCLLGIGAVAIYRRRK